MKTKFLFLALFITLTSCAHHYSPEVFEQYGFFSGIWHGIVAPLSFIGSFFIDDVYVFGQPNTGAFYYVGFVLGLLSDGSVLQH